MKGHEDRPLVVVVGGINSDYLAKGKRLPDPGETVAGDLFSTSPGGKGANQAVALARLGCSVLLVGKVGADARGVAVTEGLAAEAVDVRYVGEDAGSFTGAALIMIDSAGEKQIMAALGANGRLTEADVQAAHDEMRQAKVLLAQLEVPLPAVSRALRLARGGGLTTVLDPAPATSLPDELLRLVDVIRPNASEAGTLTGVAVRERVSASQAAHVLLERGVGAVSVQAGDEGDLLVTRDQETFFPRHPVGSIDATGAGDAFAGALAAGLAEGRPLTEAAALGSAAAALATTRLGAWSGLPTRDEVVRLLAVSEG